MVDEETQIEGRRKLIAESRAEVDQDEIQKEEREIDIVERQLDGWKTRWSHGSDGYSTRLGDGASFPWRTYPMPLTGRRMIRFLFLFMAVMITAFVIVFVLGSILL